MRALGLPLAGILAFTAPIGTHANGPGANLQATRAGPASNVCWCGMAAVRARTRGRLRATPQPAAPSKGTRGRALLTGDQTVSTAGRVFMAGRRCRLTGSGFLGARSSITRSRTGEARPGGGVIRRLRPAQSVRRGCRPSHPASTPRIAERQPLPRLIDTE